MEIIASHANPDFDSCASMVAAARIYSEARPVFLGSQNRNVREFFALHGGMVDFMEVSLLDKDEVSRLIVVDTRVADRLGELSDVACRPGVEVFCYDHHPASADDMRCTRDFSREVGATTTILVGLLRERAVALSVFEATLLALGIHEDTGSLTFQTTTPEDARALAWLMDQGAAVPVLERFLTRALSEDQAVLYRQLEQTGRIERVNGVDILVAQAVLDEYVDAASVLTHRLADSMDVEVIFSLVQMKDRVHLIGRSRVPEVDVGAVLAEFGGGGHPQAASAAVRRRPIELVAAELREALEAHVRAPLTARDVMSRAVRTVGPQTPVGKAGALMARHGHGAVPVVRGERLAGLITRRDVEKAASHGLGHAPVTGFMSRTPVIVGPDTTVADIERLLIEEGVGRLPVVAGGKLVGIVSRKDVLRAKHGRDYVAEAAGSVNTSKEAVRSRLASQLPGDVNAVLARLGALASKHRSPVYLVGGFVRDLLLGVANLDLDVVVEGDGIAFAEAVISDLGGRLRSHRKFGTAVVLLPNGFRLDVASARSEFYTHPAALPTVEHGASIRQDLARRDFTINSMAVALGGEDDGLLVDFFGGVRDLERRVVRVLHNLSFVEDPTRIYRGVRFEQRHGFKMDVQTETLAREAVRMGIHAKLSGSRVREELIALLSEKDAWRAFRRLIDLGAAKELEPAARLSVALGTRFTAVEEAVRRLDPFFAHPTRQWLAHLMVVMQTVPIDEVAAWSKEMRLRRGDTATLARGVSEGRALVKRLSGPKGIPNSALDETLGEVPQEILAYVWALGGTRVRCRVEHYLEHVADVRPAITGRDLMAIGAQPSPELGRVLALVRAARQDGKVRDKPGELALARELLGLEPLGGRALRKAARGPAAKKRRSAAAGRAPGRQRKSG